MHDINSFSFKDKKLNLYKIQNALILCLLPLFLSSQDQYLDIKNKDITLRIGISRSQLEDSRLSGKVHKSWSPKYSISHIEVKDNSRQHFQVDFASMKFSKSNKRFSIQSIFSNVHFTYQRNIGNGTWLGGYINTISLINFPKNPGQTYFVNNPVSYTVSSSIGPAVSFTHGFDNGIHSIGTAQMAAISYAIQPIYGHPYPEKYLNEEIFSPTQSKMAGPLLKSGKLVSFKSFGHLNILMSVYYVFKNNFKAGLDYNYGFYMVNVNGKPVKMNNHDIFLTTGILY